MVKRFLLEIQPEPSEYHMLGISCHMPDYRLSYLINQHLDLQFIKKEDLVTRSFKKENEAPFSFYHYEDEDNYCTMMLISNRSEEFVLVPEIKQVDYFMIIDGEIKRQRKDHFLKTIRGIHNVLTSFEMKPDQIKNASMLFSDIEMHMTFLKRAEKIGAYRFTGAEKTSAKLLP